MKLIKTKLFLHGDRTWASIATASHLDYARVYRRQKFKELLQKDTFIDFLEDVWQFLLTTINFMITTIIFICDLIFIPLGFLTAGWLYVPLYMFMHKRIVDRLIEQDGVESLNKQAKELVKEKEVAEE